MEGCGHCSTLVLDLWTSESSFLPEEDSSTSGGGVVNCGWALSLLFDQLWISTTAYCITNIFVFSSNEVNPVGLTSFRDSVFLIPNVLFSHLAMTTMAPSFFSFLSLDWRGQETKAIYMFSLCSLWYRICMKKGEAKSWEDRWEWGRWELLDSQIFSFGFYINPKLLFSSLYISIFPNFLK